MTVKELITELLKYNSDAIVILRDNLEDHEYAVEFIQPSDFNITNAVYIDF